MQDLKHITNEEKNSCQNTKIRFTKVHVKDNLNDDDIKIVGTTEVQNNKATLLCLYPTHFI